MIHLLNFADDRMTMAQMLCTQSAFKNGAGKVYQYNQHHISEEFRELNKDVLSAERGAGYWLWKPYFTNRVIQKAHDGDIVIYMDAGCELVNNVSHIIDRMDQDIFFFTNGWPHVHWCKMDVMINICPGFDAVDDRPRTDIENTDKQVQASAIFFKVNQTTRNFVKEWLLWCQMPGLIDDSPSKLPNHPEFAEHRHDQAILTCMQIKYGYKLHWWPTQYSEHIRHTGQPEDNYPVMFNHHRKRNNEC